MNQKSYPPLLGTALFIIWSLLANAASAQSKILLPEVNVPPNVQVRAKPQPDVPQGNHGLPKFSLAFEPSQFNIPKENYLVVKLFEVLGKPAEAMNVEFDHAYYIDYFAERMGVASREGRAAALAALSPAAAAAFTGPPIKANGIVYILAQGRVNEKPFAIRTEYLYTGTNDPATTRRSDYAQIAEAALNRAAQDIADAIRAK